MADEPSPGEPGGQILIYRDGGLNLRVRLDGRTVWLTQKLIAELFQVSVKTANEHLVNIYGDGELDAVATIRKFRIVQIEGSREDEKAPQNTEEEQGMNVCTTKREQTAQVEKLDKMIWANLEDIGYGE